MRDAISTWDALRRLADELELTLHLADPESRDPWSAIQPRLAKLERWFRRTTRRPDAADGELMVLACAVRKLRHDLEHLAN